MMYYCIVCAILLLWFPQQSAQGISPLDGGLLQKWCGTQELIGDILFIVILHKRTHIYDV